MNMTDQLRIQRMYDEAAKNGRTEKHSDDTGASGTGQKKKSGRPRKQKLQDSPSEEAQDQAEI